MSKRNETPHILNGALTVAAYCEERGNAEFIKKTIFWISDHKMMWKVRIAINDLIPRAKLKKAILDNKKLEYGYK